MNWQKKIYAEDRIQKKTISEKDDCEKKCKPLQLFRYWFVIGEEAGFWMQRFCFLVETDFQKIWFFKEGDVYLSAVCANSVVTRSS